MIDSMLIKEFVGRLVISYKIGEIIYAYDEITHGLYEFSIYTKKVNMAIPPESIHRNSCDKIMGISRNRNELILIPLFLDSEWIFYDFKGKKIRYNSLFKSKISISGTITIGTNLFLIPSDIYNPIIIVSLDDMKIIKIYERWNKQSKKGNGIYVWGASSYDELVIFPVINSNYIGCVNMSDLNMITLNIPDPIFSVSIYKDKIWILPVSGKYIFVSDIKGKIISKIDLSQIELRISANSFNRIIATKETVFLLPQYGEDIYAYQYQKRQIIRIDVGEAYLYGRLYEREITPYWDFIIENEMLHILPRDCRYKKINIHSLENKEICLCYGENINYSQYWEILIRFRKDYVYENKKNDLEDFSQYTLHSAKNYVIKANEKVGRKIWEKVIKENNYQVKNVMEGNYDE